jgi:hypothetical protein
MSTLSRYVSSSTGLSGVTWRRSRHSTAANNCVETARLATGELAVRDSKAQDGPALLFAPGAWTEFIRALSGGGPGRV